MAYNKGVEQIHGDMLVGREHLKQKKGHRFDLLVEREQGKIKKAHYQGDCPVRGAFLIGEGKLMAYRFCFMSSDFYERYKDCSEIEKKPNRPHLRLLIDIGNITLAVPFRSNISHPHALLTDSANKSGLDFSKALVIKDALRDIDLTRTPHIRPNEFDALRGKEYIIQQRMMRYIRAYARAKTRPDVPRNRILLEYSTLKYFPEEERILIEAIQR